MLASVYHIEDVRDLSKDRVCQFDNRCLLVFSTATAALTASEHERVEQCARFVQVLRDRSIVVESEDLGIRIQRQALGVADIGISLAMCRCEVQTRGGERVVVREDPLIEVVLKQDLDQDSVICISHTTSIVALGGEILESIERRLVRILVQVDLELSHGDTKIGLVELVADVPAQRSIETPLLNDSMEEGESKDELSEFAWIA